MNNKMNGIGELKLPDGKIYKGVSNQEFNIYLGI